VSLLEEKVEKRERILEENVQRFDALLWRDRAETGGRIGG